MDYVSDDFLEIVCGILCDLCSVIGTTRCPEDPAFPGCPFHDVYLKAIKAEQDAEKMLCEVVNNAKFVVENRVLY